MGNGSIGFGNKSAIRKSGRPVVEGVAGSDSAAEPGTDRSIPLKLDPRRICGAMSQQCGDNGNASAPQKFVHLVGCRDPKTRLEPWVRPRPAALKQQS